MAYQSIFAAQKSSPDSGTKKASGYQSVFGFQAPAATPTAAPKSNDQQVADATAAGQKAGKQAADKAAKQQQDQAKKGSSIFDKVKSFASSATIGEQKLAQGVARVLPGGTNDLKAQERATQQNTKNLQTYHDLYKSGKMSAAQYQKALSQESDSANQTVKTTADIKKAMPSKAGIAFGAASTAADILTAGTAGKIQAGRAGLVSSKAVLPLVEATGKKAIVHQVGQQVAGNAAAGALNAAAGGGTKDDVIKNAAAGAAFPIGLHAVGKVGGSILSKFSRGGPKPPINSLPESVLDDHLAKTAESTPTPPQPGSVIQPDPMRPRAEPRVEGDVSSKPIVATQAHKQAVDDLIAKAHIEHPVFQQNMNGIAADLGLKYTPGPVKDAGRTLTKVMEDYQGDHTRMKDTVRGTIEVPDHSEAGFNKVIDSIKQKYKVVEIKDGYKNHKGEFGGGYADMKVTVETPGGHKSEIILATPEMLKAKNEGGGHKLYEISRDSTKSEGERAAAGEQMRTLYGNAHDAANKRLASSGETPLNSTNAAAASASDTGSPMPYRKAPTSLEDPVTTTSSRSSPDSSLRTASTTSSSDIKKVGLSADSEGNRSVIPSTVAEKAGEVKPSISEARSLTPVETAHMPEIGGYTHSSHMEQDYADMLRDTESTFTGGQIQKQADGTYKRGSEHTRFYRDFYKENGHAPTKADWLDEAKRQLAGGKDQFGAADDYKALKEREAKPIPGLDVTLSVPAEQPMRSVGDIAKERLAQTKRADAIEAKGGEAPKTSATEVTTGKDNSRIFERLQQEHPDLFEGDLKYQKTNHENQTKVATDLLHSDPAKLYRVAMGYEGHGDLTLGFANAVLSMKAMDEGNFKLYTQLIKNVSLKGTRLGQEVESLKALVTDNSTNRYVKELLNSRLDKLGSGYLDNVGKAIPKMGNKVSSKMKAMDKIDREVVKAQKTIKGDKKFDLATAQALIDKLAC